MQRTANDVCFALNAVAASLLLATSSASAAVNSGSTGVRGALSPTATVEIPLPEDGVLHYTTVNIPKGVTVTFTRNKLNTPVYLLATGDVDIAGFIDVRGGNAKPTGTAGDGSFGDDSLPGEGGPGAFDGGRGGREDAAMLSALVNGAPGQGPGGGAPGTTAAADCTVGGLFTRFPYYGGGAGHATGAYRVGTTSCGTGSVANVGSQFFAKSYGSSLLQPLVGGSGGGGGRGGTRFGGSGGGGGGGAILIASSGTINIAAGGGINATGGDGGDVKGDGAGYWGGGGSGGAIRLVATKVTGSGGLWADGGCVVLNGSPRFCGLGNGWEGQFWDHSLPNVGGARGRVRIEAETNAYGNTPVGSYTTDTPGPIFLSKIPSLRIVSVGANDVPEVPLGGADVTFADVPATSTTVTFKTTNVPPGGTVMLRLAPESGNVIEVISPAITGTTAEGTASVSVLFPPGTSSLMAYATYSVSTPVALAPELSRYANNEKVEQIELTVASEGEPKAQLVTASGKRIDISYAQLLAAGFKG
ncbi:MAG TPA: hypothetical protein VK195_10955 [Burkholderiaceae bacterium]|nr:hypothetical protein [Burkholderiaceae bacterium]